MHTRLIAVLIVVAAGAVLALPPVRSTLARWAVLGMASEPMPPWVDRLMADNPEGLALFASDFFHNGDDALDDLRVVTHVNFVHDYAPEADDRALVDHARGVLALVRTLQARDPATCERFRTYSGAWREARELAPDAFHAAFEPIDRIVGSGGPGSTTLDAQLAETLAAAHLDAGSQEGCDGIISFYGRICALDDRSIARLTAHHLASRPPGTFALLPVR